MTEKQRREWLNKYLQDEGMLKSADEWGDRVSKQFDAEIAKASKKSNSKKKS